jgi:sarcosine oxidase
MAMEALPLWRELEDDAGRTLLEITGAVDHGDPAAIDATVAAMNGAGAPFELLDPGGAAKRWPGMRFEGSVLFHPDGGRCLADATVRALHERAAAHGADVCDRAGPATVMLADGGVEVRARGDVWRARTAVVTAGGWATSVLGELADRIPALRVTREQVQHFEPTDPSADWPSFIHHRGGWVYGLLTLGEGMKVAMHHAGPEVDPDSIGTIDDAMAADVACYVRDWFPGLDPTPVHAARCLYTSTPDEGFLLERHGPIVIGSPCSGHGFKFTPLIGRMLADLAMQP